ncbi:MAG: HlyC/CorC family transporter [Chromatiales bacterium]|nr:HlyC/CorC family transporter [Chromatiales bacterium]
MEDIPIYILLLIIFVLLFLSAFFSGSETALMAANRYRLMHRAKEGSKDARKVLKLLEKPDQLIALILLGNNLVNIIIAQLAAYIGYLVYGEIGIAIAAFVLTFVLLIFAEMTPKTIAVLHPDRLAAIAGRIYTILRIVLYPFIRFSNLITNNLLKLLGIKQNISAVEALSREELRTAVVTAGKHIPSEYRNMLLGILDLEKRTVIDIMVPRSEIYAINIADPIEQIEKNIYSAIYTRIPLCDGTIDNIIGILHTRNFLSINHQDITADTLKKMARAPYFITEHTSLNETLIAFKKKRRRVALVTNEFGEVQGLATMEDLLEEIIGEFTNDPKTYDTMIAQRADGSVIVDGGCYVRELNKTMGWSLNESGPKTINGLVLEYLELIPESATCVLIDKHPFEVIKTHKNAVKIVKILPSIEKV